MSVHEPEKTTGLDAEYLAGRRFPYQRTSASSTTSTSSQRRRVRTSTARGHRVATGGRVPCGLRPLLELVPEDLLPDSRGRENEIARKVLIKHLQSGNSYGIQLKERHAKFPQPELGPWVEAFTDRRREWKPSTLEGWEPPTTERRRLDVVQRAR